MPGLSIDIKIVFEPMGISEFICKNCSKEINGEKYTAILQMGETKMLNMTALNLSVCEDCFKQANKLS
jgi:NMD protein affecting ribosome stability and mRNA decay